MENEKATAESTGQGQATEQKNEEMVPKGRMDEVLTENQNLKEQNDLLKGNQALINANAQAQAAQATKTKQADPWEEAGLDPNDEKDIPNQAQHKKIMKSLLGGIGSQIAQLNFKVDHPDFSQIVGSAEQIRTGQYAEPLRQAIKANPTLMSTIVNSVDPYSAAYTIAKIQAEKMKGGDTNKTTKNEAQAAIDEAVNNAKSVKTSANAKGGEGLSEAGRVSTMTDAEFIKEFNAVGGDL